MMAQEGMPDAGGGGRGSGRIQARGPCLVPTSQNRTSPQHQRILGAWMVRTGFRNRNPSVRLPRLVRAQLPDYRPARNIGMDWQLRSSLPKRSKTAGPGVMMCDGLPVLAKPHALWAYPSQDFIKQAAMFEKPVSRNRPVLARSRSAAALNGHGGPGRISGDHRPSSCFS